MSKIEIISLILLCLVPFVAIVMVLPKIKKAAKKTESEKPKPANEPVKEVKPETVETKPEPIEVKPEQMAQTQLQPANNYLDSSNNDFKDYLNKKRARTTAPTRINDFSIPTSSSDAKKPPMQKDALAELVTASPDLLALIMSGILDTKF